MPAWNTATVASVSLSHQRQTEQCIQEECKDWLLGFEEALLDNFSEEKGSKLMAGAFTLKLGWGLCQPPFIIVSPANVQVQALGKEGAGTD